MRRAKTRTERILDLVRCSSLILFFATQAGAVTVIGVPSWLKEPVTRSINAVWQEIPTDIFTDREATLKVVCERLFTGYNVDVKSGEEPTVELSFDRAITPEVRITPPALGTMAKEWFEADTAGLSEEVAQIASGVPQGALTWSEEYFKSETGRLITERLPGWEFSQNVYISDKETVITLTFRPSEEMILAVKPELYSRTIPVMFRSDLEAKLLPEFSVLTGLPVKWAEKHAKEIERRAEELLEDRNSVENMRADVRVNFRASKVSKLDAVVDSRTFRFTVWVSAYAGVNGKYPEAGAFFGFRPVWHIGDYNFAPEIYTEILFELDDFGFSYRIGERFELLENLWAGIEYGMPESEFFMRLEYLPLKIRRPYGKWRFSLSSSLYEVELGYRIDEHVSLGIYYDGNVGIRGMWNL